MIYYRNLWNKSLDYFSKLSCNCPSSFTEDDKNVKWWKPDNGWKVVTIAHMILWVRWPKIEINDVNGQKVNFRRYVFLMINSIKIIHSTMHKVKVWFLNDGNSLMFLHNNTVPKHIKHTEKYKINNKQVWYSEGKSGKLPKSLQMF